MLAFTSFLTLLSFTLGPQQESLMPSSRLLPNLNLWVVQSRVHGVPAHAVFSPSSAETVISPPGGTGGLSVKLPVGREQ